MENSKAHIEILNTFGRFAQYYTSRRFAAIGKELFSSSPKARFTFFDGNVNAVGRDAICSYFESLEKTLNHREFLLTHTYGVRFSDSTHAKATCMAHSFGAWDVPDDNVISEYAVKRFDADMVLEEGRWVFEALESYYFISMVPETYDPHEYEARHTKDWSDLEVPEYKGVISAADYVEIRQLQNRWCQDKRIGGSGLFSERSDVSMNYPLFLFKEVKGSSAVKDAHDVLDDLEQRNDRKFIDTVMTTSGVIEADEDGQRAKGSWLVISNQILGPAFGHSEFYCPNICRLGIMQQEFIKENGSWKILHFDLQYLFCLPKNTFDRESSRQSPISRPGENWPMGPEVTGATNRHYEDVLEIEQLVCQWTYCLRNRSFGPFYYTYYAKERKDLVEPGFEKSGKMFGLTDSFGLEQPKYTGLHCGTTALVEVSEDGNYAVAAWLDYGFTSYGEKFGFTENPFYANGSVARYQFHCVKSEGRWKMYRFSWQPFYRIRYLADFWRFDYRTTKGWAGADTGERFPLAFSPYHYVAERRDWTKPFVFDPPEISTPFELQVGKVIGD